MTAHAENAALHAAATATAARDFTVGREYEAVEGVWSDDTARWEMGTVTMTVTGVAEDWPIPTVVMVTEDGREFDLERRSMVVRNQCGYTTATGWEYRAVSHVRHQIIVPLN